MRDPSQMGVELCLSGDTRVAVADGTSRTFQQLAEAGQDVNVLCVDTNGVVVVRRMRQPHMTEAKADVYETLLENGCTFTGTAGQLVLQQDHTEREIGCLEREGSTIWYGRREGELITRNGHERYRAFGSVAIPQEQAGRPTHHKCENCGVEFQRPYVKHALVFCSAPCETTHKSKLLKARRESDAEYDGVRVRTVHRVERADVFNGTVDEFHNFCIVVSQEKGAAEILVCVNSL